MSEIKYYELLCRTKSGDIKIKIVANSTVWNNHSRKIERELFGKGKDAKEYKVISHKILVEELGLSK